jgi:hypothetical protein
VPSERTHPLGRLGRRNGRDCLCRDSADAAHVARLGVVVSSLRLSRAARIGEFCIGTIIFFAFIAQPLFLVLHLLGKVLGFIASLLGSLPT